MYEEIFRQSDANLWKVENGNITPLNYGTKTIAEAAKFTPSGAYTTFRTYDIFGVLRFTKHLDRLEETSRLAGYDIHPDRTQLKDLLAALMAAFPSAEKRIRVTIDLEKEPGSIYLAWEKLAVPAAELYRHGIRCLTTEAHRDNPKAKLSSFLEKADEIRGQQCEACDEILMAADDGKLLEGLSSNFYGVIDDTVYTAEEGVLSGTTRDFILKLAQQLEIPVDFSPVRLSDLDKLDEAFISSTSRSILPVYSIDGIIMKKPVPGPVTRRLMDKFESELRNGIENLLSIE